MSKQKLPEDKIATKKKSAGTSKTDELVKSGGIELDEEELKRVAGGAVDMFLKYK
jgi:hypothetical protein